MIDNKWIQLFLFTGATKALLEPNGLLATAVAAVVAAIFFFLMHSLEQEKERDASTPQ